MKKNGSNQKKYISKKKKVVSAIVFVLAALVAGTVVHGLFLKDTTESKTIADTEVVENELYKDIPKDDSTPADYSPEENISICQSVMQNMNAWTSKTEGTAVADVLFINYTQKISASKVIKDGSATQQTASESSLLSTGQQRTFKDDAILIREAKKVKSLDNIEWEDDFTAVSKDTYAQNYGRTPFALTNYVIDKTTILKSKTLDSDKGKFKYEYELKPDESTVYYKRQMKTEGGASDYPTFHSVKVTVTMDEQWRPLEIHYSENYDINISVVGDVTCQGEVTETFSDFGEVNALPDQDLVDDYIKNKYDKNKLSDLPTKEGTDISKYITDMFTKNPYYNVKVSVGDTALDMNLYVDINNGTIKIKSKDLFAAYSNEKVYIQFGNIKVCVKADSIFEAIKIIGNAVDLDTQTLDLDYLTQIDLNHISLDDQAVSGLLNDVKLEQSDDAIQVAFAKDGIQADVKVTLQDETVSLNYANVSFKLGDNKISAKVTTTNPSNYPNLKGFNDISEVTALLQPWIDTVQAKGISAKVSIKADNVKLSGTAVLGYDPLKFRFTTKIDGVKITATVTKKRVYISAGNIKVKCRLNNIEGTIKQVMVMLGMDMKKNKLVPKQYADTINQLKNGNVNIEKLVKSVKSVSFNEGKLNVKATINKLGFQLAVSKDTIKINQGKNLSVKAKIKKKYKKSPKIKVKKTAYVGTKKILKTLSKLSLYKLLKSKGIILDTRISGKGFELKGVAKASYSKGFVVKYTTNIEGVPVTLIYKKNVIYVKSGNIKIKGSSKYTYKLLKTVLQKTGVKLDNKTLLQAKSFDDAFKSLIKEYAGNLTIKDIIGNVKTFKYKKGYLILKYQYAKGKAATIKLKKKTLSLSAAVLEMNLNVKLKIQKIYTKSPKISVNSKNYTKLSDIINVLEKFGLEDLIASTGIDTDVTLNINGKSVKANVKASYGNSIALWITTNITKGKTTIPLSVKYLNHTFYIDVANIHVKAKENNVETVLSQVLKNQNVSDIFAKDLSTTLKGLISTLSAKDIIDNIQSFSCNKNTLKIQYKMKQQILEISITGKTVSVKGMKLDNKNLNVSAKINNTKNQNIAVNNKGQYVDFETAYNLIKTNIDEISKAKAIGLKADIQFGEQKLSADILYDQSVNACKVTIPYHEEELEVTYLDDVIYVHLGQYYIKSTKEKLLELVKQYSGYELDQIFAGKDIKDKLSLALIFNIKNVAMENGKLVVEYVQNQTSLKALIENKRDEIQISGIKIGDTSVSGTVVLERCFNESVIKKSDYENDSYLDLNKALDIIDINKVDELLQAKGALFDVNVAVNDYGIEGQLKLSWEDELAGQLDTTIEGIDTEITLKNDNIYINASNIKLVYEKINEALFDVVHVSDISQTVEKITDVKIVDNKIVVYLTSDETSVEISITKEQIGIVTGMNDTKIDVTLKPKEICEEAPAIEVKKVNYSKVTDFIGVLKKFGMKELFNATGIEANITLNINGENISGQFIYCNETLYLHIGNVYMKTDTAYILSILKENGIDMDADMSAKDIIEQIAELTCTEEELSLIYGTDNPLTINVSEKTVSLNDIVKCEIVGTDVTEVEDDDKYIDLKTVIDFVKKWKDNPAVRFSTSIGGRDLSCIYENNMVYVEFDGLRLKSDDSSAASIVNAVLKIYNVDITPVLEWFGIVEDEKDINLGMFKQYTEPGVLDDWLKNSSLTVETILNHMSISNQEISYEGNISDSRLQLKLYDSDLESYQPEKDNYIDAGSMDTLLKAFSITAENMKFDIRGKANLALKLGLINLDYDVPLSAKLQVENEGVYGNVHADVPYMKGVNDTEISTPETVTETFDDTGKTKTEVKTSYSLISDSVKISTDFFVTPDYIYIHKNIQYKLEKKITTTPYKKVIIWIPQYSSQTTETETVEENKDFYMKRTYQEMQDNVMSDLCFALNMTDSMKKMIMESINNTDTESVKLGNILKSYSFDNRNQFDFGLNLSSLTNGAIADTKVNLYKNDNGYLNQLYAECKLYSFISIKLDADLNDIEPDFGIGFVPEQLAKDEHYK